MKISISMNLLMFKQKAVSFDVSLLTTESSIPFAVAVAVSPGHQASSARKAS